jgi:hypothetical protein
MKRFVVLGILAAVAAGVYFAMKLLPWWAIILAAVAVVVVGKMLVGRFLRALLIMPFKAKGAVLRGATARVNAVAPIPRDGESDGLHYDLDVTVTPAGNAGPFSHWEPGELRLVRFDCKLDVEHEDEDESCKIESVEVQQDGQFQADEGMKFPGEQRMKLRIAVTPGTNALKFRYYFEEFGEIRLDDGVRTAAA